ncbi:MAG: sugar ABC transporter substrate-binding protein [Clostridia bacterium]|nr:sugar ABC transporter substrate-binding protein [Clostridia bacterium]
MKRIFSIILIVVMCASIFAGCNDKKDSDKVTLRLGLPSGYDITAKEVVDNFQKAHPEIELEIDETPWSEFKKKVKLQSASKTAPTVFIMDSGHVAYMGANGMAVDLADRVKSDLNADDYSSALYAGQDAEGHLWGIPHGLNTLAIYYNEEIFDEAGLEYPDESWTFDDMIKMAKKLTKDLDSDGEVDQYGLMLGTNISTGWLPFVLAEGGAPLDETRTKSMFKDKKTVSGLKKYVDCVKDGIAPDAEWSAAQGGTAAFYTGKIGMYIALHSMIPVIENNAPEGFRYNAQIMPYGVDGKRPCVYVPNLWVVSSTATEEEQEAAWTWIKYYMSDEAQKIMTESGLDGIQVKKTAIEYMEQMEYNGPENLSAFYSGLEKHGTTIYENGTYEEWRPKADEIITQMRNGLVGFNDGIKELDSVVSKVLKGEY